MTRYFLAGLPCTGKTTLGKLLADHLNIPFIDLDEKIKTSEKSCRELFLEEGEERFRKREGLALDTLKSEDKAIIALGGGTLNTLSNRQKIATLGKIIYLKEDPEVVWNRHIHRGLPAYLDKNDPKGSFFKLAADRTIIYEAEALYTVELKERSLEALLKELIHGIQ